MKYIIEIENEPFGRNDDPFFPHGMDELYRAKGFKSLVFDQGGLDKLTPYTETDRKAIDLQHAHDIENVARMNYSKGAEEAWELARRIICPSDCCEDSISAYTKEIFNKDGWEIRGIFKDLPYQEAKSKYEAWKKQKAEIRVGDEVKENSGLWTGVVVGFDEVDDLIIMDRSGKSCAGYKTRFFRKTGRHFDEVEELLKKMGDEK